MFRVFFLVSGWGLLIRRWVCFMVFVVILGRFFVFMLILLRCVWRLSFLDNVFS